MFTNLENALLLHQALFGCSVCDQHCLVSNGLLHYMVLLNVERCLVLTKVVRVVIYLFLRFFRLFLSVLVFKGHFLFPSWPFEVVNVLRFKVGVPLLLDRLRLF